MVGSNELRNLVSEHADHALDEVLWECLGDSQLRAGWKKQWECIDVKVKPKLKDRAHVLFDHLRENDRELRVKVAFVVCFRWLIAIPVLKATQQQHFFIQSCAWNINFCSFERITTLTSELSEFVIHSLKFFSIVWMYLKYGRSSYWHHASNTKLDL